jgi:hypothetical protein
MARGKRLRELGDRSQAPPHVDPAVLTVLGPTISSTDGTVSTPEQLAQTAMLGRVGKLA